MQGVRSIEMGDTVYHLNQPNVQALLRMLRLAGYPSDGDEMSSMLVTMTSESAYNLSTMELINYRKVGLAIWATFTPRGLRLANKIKNEDERRQRALKRATPHAQ